MNIIKKLFSELMLNAKDIMLVLAGVFLASLIPTMPMKMWLMYALAAYVIFNSKEAVKIPTMVLGRIFSLLRKVLFIKSLLPKPTAWEKRAFNQKLLDKYFGEGVVMAGEGRGQAALATASKTIRSAYNKEMLAFRPEYKLPTLKKK